VGHTGFVDAMPSSLHKGHRYPVEIISHMDRDEHLVEMPFIAWAWPTATQPVREALTELAAPLMDGLVRDQDIAGHHLLDLPQALSSS
jgi:hypothetical protein